ncbi:hypothetical protein CCACVL1_18431 [Corchorus capsularis]|uniref:SHSP domain-containing protein n=1 Tax=Corchorus capsularis TaxID=210143 RepID=A0A1R3HL31_COCAP|nr:hypothetical protein CCACVL1_18431 [Corchorus capsularis]
MGGEPKPVYEEFELQTEWKHEESNDALLAYIPAGFKRKHMRIILISDQIVRISGQRPIGDNKFGRFNKEIPVPLNVDTSKMNASVKDGILWVKCPKPIITPAQKQEEEEEGAKPSEPAPQPQRTENGQQKQTNGPGPEQDVQDAPPKEPSHVSHKAPDITAAANDQAHKTIDGTGKNQQQLEIFKQVLNCLFLELKNPRKGINMVLVVFLVLLLVIYLLQLSFWSIFSHSLCVFENS